MGVSFQESTTLLGFCTTQAQWAPPPVQVQLTPTTEAEFVICDQTISMIWRAL
jgi:hypothetical protein